MPELGTITFQGVVLAAPNFSGRLAPLSGMIPIELPSEGVAAPVEPVREQGWDAEHRPARALHGRQEQPDERADDGNHHQQFDERKDLTRRDSTYFSIPRCVNGQMKRKQINTEIFPPRRKIPETNIAQQPSPPAQAPS